MLRKKISNTINVKYNPEAASKVVHKPKDKGKTPKNFSGLYRHSVIIKIETKKGIITIDNDTLDCDFEIPFDDDVEANIADISIYNLSKDTRNKINGDEKITVEAGYGKDTGIIFSGYIKKVKHIWEDLDLITDITAIDSKKRKEHKADKKTYAKGTKASTILKDLVNQTGLPVKKFSIPQDHVYKDAVSISGGLMENIEKYAGICKAKAYICKSQVYVCSVKDFTGSKFELTSDTGLLSVETFKETNKNDVWEVETKGYKVKMLLQHRVQTGSLIKFKTKNYSGSYRVIDGTHYYDGSEFTTTVRIVKSETYEKVKEKTSAKKTDTNIKQQSLKEKILSRVGKNQYTQGANRMLCGSGYSDCSSLQQWVYKQVLGVDIGGDTDAQQTNSNLKNVSAGIQNGYPDVNKLQIGDLLYFKGTDSSRVNGVGHVEMYVGNGKLCGHGSGTGPNIKDMNSYIKWRIGYAGGGVKLVRRYKNF
ncbi:MAG: phage protein [Lachnospiraceae bacterium]